MSFGRKIASFFTLVIAVITLNSFATAQVSSTEKDGTSVEKRQKKQNRYGQKGKRGKRGKRGMRGNRDLMRSLSKLDLSDSQKSQMRTMLETERTSNQTLRDESRALFTKKREGTITETEKTRLGEIRNEMKNSGQQTKNSILALLTPEQTQKLEKMKAKRKQKMEERRERRQQRRQEMRSESPTTTKEVG